jgi:hypothetical protein
MIEDWEKAFHLLKATHEARLYSLNQQYERLGRGCTALWVVNIVAIVAVAALGYGFVLESMSLTLAWTMVFGEMRRAHRRRMAEYKRYIAALRALHRRVTSSE